MDSTDYFKRAERANRRFRRTVIILVLVATVLFAGILVRLRDVQQYNHNTSTASLNIIIDNEAKLNTNLTNSLHCILLLTPQTYNTKTVNNCFKLPNNITTQPNN